MGNGIVAPDGEIDRGALADVVFNDPEALAWLEHTLHPLVTAEYLQWREQLATLPDAPEVCVTEVPLLYETGGDARFDKVVVITAPTKLRRSRSAVAVNEREARLLPDAEKVKRADYAYVNTGSLEELDAFVAGLMRELVA
jgi:dephospho-CoA kinase